MWVGDALHIDAPDGHYDAVFDFGIIHHIPDWRAALAEVHRVLRPGGRLYAEEVLESFILHPVWRRLLDHPTDDRFDAAGFRAGLQGAGFTVTAERDILDKFAFYVAHA